MNKFTPLNIDSKMEGGTLNLDVPAVDGIRSRAESGGSDFGAYRKSGGRIGTSGDWNRQRYEVSSIDPSMHAWLAKGQSYTRDVTDG